MKLKHFIKFLYASVIILISWGLATTIATTPSNNIKQSIGNIRNFPRFSYAYSIENDDGREQRKTESKFDDLSSGQYYINNNLSSTDVKYLIDKWGYHPIVKYSMSNDHNATSSAQSVFDDRPIYDLINTTDNGNRIIIPTNIESNIPSEHESWESLQPPIRKNINIYNHSKSELKLISNVNNTELTNDSLFQQQQESKNDAVEYNTIKKLLNSNDSIASSHQDVTQTMYLSSDRFNSDEFENARTIVIKNASLGKEGEKFGQRLQQNLLRQYNTTNQSNLRSLNTGIANTNENDLALRQQTSSYNYRTALANFRKNLKLDDVIADIQLDHTRELETSEGDNANSQIELPAILNDTKKRVQNSRDEWITIDTNPEITFLDKITLLQSNENVKFSRPIVVAEISNIDQLKDSTVFSCSEEHAKLIPFTTIGIDTSSLVTDKTSIPHVTPILLGPQIFEGESHITVSSNAWNPIQVGLASVNANEALTPIANTMKFTKKPDNMSQFSNILPIRKSAVNKFDKAIKNSPHTSSPVNHQTIEIEKSLELYHSSPIQEIHYPAQLMPVVTLIDQQQGRTNKHQRNVKFSKDNVDSISHNGKIWKYESTVNQHVSKSYKPKKPSNSNDPTSIYVIDNRQQVYGNNDKQLAHSLENRVNRIDQLRIVTSQNNSRNTKNKYIDTRLITEIYLPYESKNSYSIIESHELGNIDNDKLMKQDMAVITTEVSPRTQLIPQNRFSGNTESNDVVHHLEVDGMSNGNQHIHKFKDIHEVVNPHNLSFTSKMSNQNIHEYIQVKPSSPFMSILPVLSKRHSSLNKFANTKQYYRRQQSSNYPSLTEGSDSTQSPFQTYTTANVNHLSPLPWYVTHRDGKKIMNKNMEYSNAAPSPQHTLNTRQLNQIVHSTHQALFRFLTDAPVPTTSHLKKMEFPTTQYHRNTGHFRQSKLEYGFKPPMIPSIQYDERMATEIQNIQQNYHY